MTIFHIRDARPALTWGHAHWLVRVVRDAGAAFDVATMARLAVGVRC